MNVLSQIDGMTTAIAAQIQPTEAGALLRQFVDALDAFNRLNTLTANNYVTAALEDMRVSVDSLTDRNPHFGQSQWASLQATEKLLKAFTDVAGGRVLRSHDLKQIAQEAERCGLPKIPEPVVRVIQCAPGARYGESATARERALAAHQSAIEIARLVAVEFGAGST